jgi:hypothetical protein
MFGGKIRIVKEEISEALPVEAEKHATTSIAPEAETKAPPKLVPTPAPAQTKPASHPTASIPPLPAAPKAIRPPILPTVKPVPPALALLPPKSETPAPPQQPKSGGPKALRPGETINFDDTE